MTKLNTLIVAIVVALASFYSDQRIWAGSDTQGDYTLTISQGNPPFSPDPPRIKANITTYFTASLVEQNDDHEEEASKKINSFSYLVSVGGDQIIIKRVSGGFTIANNKLYATKNTGGFIASVSPVVQTEISGDKSVSLSLSVTLKDGTSLSASETIEFKVPDFYFAVYVRDGKRGRKNSYNITPGANNWGPIIRRLLILVTLHGVSGFLKMNYPILIVI